MRSFITHAICLLCVIQITNAQSPRREILEAQNARRSDLIRPFLTHSDPLIRRQAALACASLQDTTLLDALLPLLMDPAVDVQQTAAFAVGQTGISLSEIGRGHLSDVITTRYLPVTHASARLCEEMGKFGTERNLHQMLTRVNGELPEGCTMALARFAIRGIVDEVGVKLLLRKCGDHDACSWQEMYALQRIGNHSIIIQNLSQVITQKNHPDPLVRMNLAALLGKLKVGSAVTETLEYFVLHDPDWRVKVNALKSLGQKYSEGEQGVGKLLRTAFRDPNPHVAITALSSVRVPNGRGGDSDRAMVRELESLIEDTSVPSGVRGEALMTLATLAGHASTEKLLHFGTSEPRFAAKRVQALGLTRDPRVIDTLRTLVAHSNPIIACASIEALQSFGTRQSDPTTIELIYRAGLSALGARDVAVLTTAAALLGDTLYLRSTSVEPLRQTFARLQVPEDLEAMQQIVQTLQRLTGKAPDIPSTPPNPGMNVDDILRLPDTVHVTLVTSRGDIGLELYTREAPYTVQNFVTLGIGKKFFDGKDFHRVVPNFVVQGGDPRGDGWGGPGYTMRSEFSPAEYLTGSLGMASAGKDTEGSQFFITHSPQPHLDGRYTNFGRVTRGMDVVDALQIGDRVVRVRIGD